MSSAFKKVINGIKDISSHSKLSPSETVSVLKALKSVSKEKLLLDKAISLFISVEDKTKQIEQLSDRENEIFNLIGHCFSSKEIAKRLEISQATVSTHRRNIIKKLKLSKTRQLNLLAYTFIGKSKAD